jgi:hypothetical protein
MDVDPTSTQASSEILSISDDDDEAQEAKIIKATEYKISKHPFNFLST